MRAYEPLDKQTKEPTEPTEHSPTLMSGDQCAAGFCCPYMKKCVASSSTGCYGPIANCQPMCYDSAAAAGTASTHWRLLLSITTPLCARLLSLLVWLCPPGHCMTNPTCKRTRCVMTVVPLLQLLSSWLSPWLYHRLL